MEETTVAFLTLFILICQKVNGAAIGLDIKNPDDPTGTDKIDWNKSGQEELTTALTSCYNIGVARNVILFLGDGMGMSTITAARWLHAQNHKRSIHDSPLSWEKFPHVALSKTYNVDVKTPDSAATATAYLTGYKVRKATIGVSQDVVPSQCSTVTEKTKLQSIVAKSHKEGKWTGVVTTTRATHATPAAAYAHAASRNWEVDSDIPEDQKDCKDIAYQLVKENNYIRVMLAGGRANFLPDNKADPEHPDVKGNRKDGLDLLEEWKNEKASAKKRAKLVMNQTDFDAVDPTKVDYLMGLFEPDHMQYEADRLDSEYEQWGEPSLAEMTEKAINILNRAEKGYFLLVEGGRIDQAHHDGNAFRALNDTLAFHDAVAVADKLTDDDTLIIVTADHSHTFTLGGYPTINRDIFDITDHIDDGIVQDKVAEDDLPYTTLAYANGPGYYYHYNTTKIESGLLRRNLTADSLEGLLDKKHYLQPSGVPLKSETHAGEDVPIYARGPMAHLFRGTHEQNYIAHVMMYASCVGENKGHCQNDGPFAGLCGGSMSGAKSQMTSLNGVYLIILIFTWMRTIL